MSDRGATPRSLNGRPLSTHERACDEELHAEHMDSICKTCGCCWGCDEDCCAEYSCPNRSCGCNLPPPPTLIDLTDEQIRIEQIRIARGGA